MTDWLEALPARLDLADLHSSLSDVSLTSMNLLNEIADRFPTALSFAAGRPYPGSFTLDDLHRYIKTYCEYVGDEARNRLFQYGATKGIIPDLIARNLAVDEEILVDPESIVVTVGCQEALFMVFRALRRSERDVLLAVSPAYVGMTGAARLVDLPVVPVESGADGIDLDDLVAKIRQTRAAGLRPRACYLVPDFANPTGLSLEVETRRWLLDCAAEHELLIVEDNPYGLFGEEGVRLPTLKSLDHHGSVVYVGSYAKTALPGARVGFVVADQRVRGAGMFADELSKIKSMLTVNTSPVSQAVIGGKLLESDFSLRTANATDIARYRGNLQLLLDGLAIRFPGSSLVRWNRPRGGYFAVLTTPFPVDAAVLEYSARQHGVIWTPMHHFYGAEGGLRQLRLSCSSLAPHDIETGLDRLASMVSDLHETGWTP